MNYINMITVSMLATTLFWGGWNVPFAEYLFGRGTILFALVSVVGFFVKIFVFLFFYIWLRGTLHDFVLDQLMDFGWKFLLPAQFLTSPDGDVLCISRRNKFRVPSFAFRVGRSTLVTPNSKLGTRTRN